MAIGFRLSGSSPKERHLRAALCNCIALHCEPIPSDSADLALAAAAAAFAAIADDGDQHNLAQNNIQPALAVRGPFGRLNGYKAAERKHCQFVRQNRTKPTRSFSFGQEEAATLPLIERTNGGYLARQLYEPGKKCVHC